MPVVELTDRFCQTAKPIRGLLSKKGELRRPQTDYFDSVVKGLCLTATDGSAKTFFLVYTRPGKGGRARLKLGRYGEIKLAEARQRARDARAAVGDGQDPIAEKRAIAASQTVSDLVENYIKRHASTLRSGAAVARRLRKNVAAEIGDIRLAELHRRDITRCIDAVADRGAGTEANRVFEDLRAMLRWARGRGDLDDNLADGMRRPTETKPRDRVLTADEIRTMWEALPAADMRESTRRIVRLCLVIGQRVGEVAGMTREEIDLGNGLWTIPPERTKNGREHRVPLPDMAIEIIREQLAEADALAKRKGRAPSPWVFPGPGARAATTGHGIAKAIKREERPVEEGERMIIMGGAPWTPHDLRRTMATHMEEIGISPFIVGHVLNHASEVRATVTSKVYARYDYAREKREALELWEERLEGIIRGAADIVPLREGAAAR